ncbi:glycoside hydrolase family 3 [Paenibacillus albidus]|uniref:beta-N-acetylhexosaminidase n=1 Tax=Paenibacillus albidus TaxID=2041023 RepID=A0A917C3D8_9BACL|nr:beta-N-acetylhexosaminidase [Paenibacillus albidus]GGF68837.1 glycoside hydrolase family 3 [Paenibacillus albidus]
MLSPSLRIKQYIKQQPRQARLLATAFLALTLSILAGCNSAGSLEGSASHVPLPSASAATPLPSVIPSPTDKTTTPPRNEEAPAQTAGNNDPVALTIAAMTLEDKIGQMLLVGIDGTQPDPETQRMIAEDKVGGIILYADNIKGLDGMVSLVNALKQSNKSNPVPLFMSVDQEGGKVSRMPAEYASIPANGKVGRTNDPQSARMMGSLLARQVLAAGFNMNFAPVLDINSNPDNPVIGDRSFGSNAPLVTKLGIAEMKGIESEGVVPVVKHFPGHGDTSVDSHLELPVVNKTAAELSKLEWLPFQAAIKENAAAVMVAHILFPQLDKDKPASLSPIIIGEQLRGVMGYQGVVITDDLTMGAILKNYDLAEAAVDTVQAGSDILLIAHEYSNERKVREALLLSVRNGTIAESRIDESVNRILSLKARYALSDEPVAVPDLNKLNKDVVNWSHTIPE